MYNQQPLIWGFQESLLIHFLYFQYSFLLQRYCNKNSLNIRWIWNFIPITKTIKMNANLSRLLVNQNHLDNRVIQSSKMNVESTVNHYQPINRLIFFLWHLLSKMVISVKKQLLLTFFNWFLFKKVPLIM